MKKKEKQFEIPFIGYDFGETHGWSFDTVISHYGNPVIGFKLKNIVQQYSADPDAYLNFHSVMNQVVSIVGEEHIVQKLDIFSKQTYKAEQSKHFLQQKYSEHFDGREFRVIDSLLFITDLVDTRNKKAKYEFSEKKYKELRDKAQKVYLLSCPPNFDHG
ncbi:hypothetical protein IMZ16_04085 [Cruoricaptor ignavus]|uniref:Uncharacterized protein n=1 Tax=Cruoricaptor ignavus TaxID=1118202 RepID=A0A7M1T4E6_9FLAO|nr:hypothetical protein [Cruoricaptor ignavus]QOR74621.1 hypothetical protein IMZ16_04085 [Cruoricaptor ignavus]